MFRLNDPKMDLHDLIRKSNPTFNLRPADWNYALLTSETDKPGNTSVIVESAGHNADGGILKLYYDRFDLSQLMTGEIATTLVAGTLVQISVLKDFLIAMTKVAFNFDGIDADVDDITFTAPVEGDSVQITLTAAATSVRFIPGTQLTFTVKNLGAPVIGVIDRRSLSVTTIGNEIIAGRLIPIDAPLLNPNLLLYSVDSSAIFSGKQPEEIFTKVALDPAGFEYALQPNVLDSLNALLTSKGLPLITNGNLGFSDYEVPLISFYQSVVLPTAGTTDDSVNTNFANYIVISQATGEQQDTVTAYASDYYFFFN